MISLPVSAFALVLAESLLVYSTESHMTQLKNISKEHHHQPHWQITNLGIGSFQPVTLHSQARLQETILALQRGAHQQDELAEPLAGNKTTSTQGGAEEPGLLQLVNHQIDERIAVMEKTLIANITGKLRWKPREEATARPSRNFHTEQGEEEEEAEETMFSITLPNTHNNALGPENINVHQWLIHCQKLMEGFSKNQGTETTAGPSTFSGPPFGPAKSKRADFSIHPRLRTTLRFIKTNFLVSPKLMEMITTMWSVTSSGCIDMTPLGGRVTTRAQLGALAAGATISRCGAQSAIFLVMGQDQATSFVRMLWLDVVRPTIRLFRLYMFASPVSRTLPTDLVLYLSFSPLLMSLSSSPGRVTTTPSDFRQVYEGLPLPFPELPRSGTGNCNTKWAVCVDMCPTTTSISDGIARMSVAPLKGGWSVGVDGFTCDVDRAVVVDVPTVRGCFAIQAYMDQSVDREVVLAQVAESFVVMVVADMEDTCNSKKLAVLSTTRCDFPSVGYTFYSLVVMRNWDDPFSPTYGSRTFLVKAMWEDRNEILKFTEGGTNSSPNGLIQCDDISDVFRLSDSLFCVAFGTENQRGSFSIFTRDDTARPLNLLQQMTYTSRKKSLVTAESGFIFRVYTTRIEVIEPTSRFVVLVITFPDVKWVHLNTPFSCFWT
ncbi:hypothetical protein Pelo_17953 [Pelomyxa schiedti]|nr:hypothetical protein Pelo_17953 [Pelomyxa schiedti]